MRVNDGQGLAALAASVLLGLSALPARAQEDEGREIDPREMMDQTGVGLQAAIASALQARAGKVVAAELEGEQVGQTREIAYDIAVVGTDDAVYSITVNPKDGKVLENEAEDDEDEVDEAREGQQVLRVSHFTAAELAARAQGLFVGATPIEVELERHHGEPLAVVRLVQGRAIIDVALEVRAGDLVGLRLHRDRKGDAGDERREERGARGGDERGERHARGGRDHEMSRGGLLGRILEHLRGGRGEGRRAWRERGERHDGRGDEHDRREHEDDGGV
jgi:uncharacterized membrane protein YkoI